jgi:hypothetical protein
MSQAGFESTTPVSERVKIVYASDREATVIGNTTTTVPLLFLLSVHFFILHFSFQLNWGGGGDS